MATMNPDDRAAAALPVAASLAAAVDHQDAQAVAAILRPLSTAQLHALAVVLAAHVDVPLTNDRRPRDEVDWALVERVVGGDTALTGIATRDERRLITERWVAAGRSLVDLERLTGWRADRYGRAPRCGTDSGYYRHTRALRDTPCAACKSAHAAAERERRARARKTKEDAA